jgi:hypothetical protein
MKKPPISDSDAEKLEQLKSAVARVAEANSADVVLLNAPIRGEVPRSFIRMVRDITPRRPNIFLILVTLGGNAHAGYTMARALQRLYKEVTVCVHGDCYSTGTLICLGAHELVISDDGHLGPLDVQIDKKDELGEASSGMVIGMALSELESRAFETFETFMLELKVRSEGRITTKTAMEIACHLTTPLFGEIYRQIDPQRIGEDARAMEIAKHYGRMLTRHAKTAHVIERLQKSYPDHGCIIDREEAEKMFGFVRAPLPHEQLMLDLLGPLAQDARSHTENAQIQTLSHPCKSPHELPTKPPSTKAGDAGVIRPAATQGRTPGRAHSQAAARGNGKSNIKSLPESP